MLFSLIIPVYNVENYLKECLDSICSQTYSNLEIILVDDGSMDHSGLICDQYAANDNRIQVIHKENGGLSSARNAAIDLVTGDYVFYLDSDDYLSNDFFALCHSELEQNSYDMIISGQCEFWDGDKSSELRILNKKKKMSNIETLENMYYQYMFDTNAWGKLMRRDIAAKYHFREGILYEDFDIIYRCIYDCENVLYLPDAIYYYRLRQESIMHSAFNEKKLELLRIAENHIYFANKHYPELMEAVIRRYVYSYFHILGRTVKEKKYESISEEIREKILQYKKNIQKNPKVPKKEKISIFILNIGMMPYRICWTLFCFFKGKRV